MGDSAFRRLLLDTVSTVIAQPPSTASLIDLLRIATPSLLASISSSKQQQDDAHAIVRDASQREKLFRTLQLRIHPDKHSGEERATALFQDVTTFYGKCVDAMERDGTRRWGTDVSGTRATTSSNDNPSTTASGSKTNQNRWHPPSPPQYPRGSTSTTASSSSTPHSNYVRSEKIANLFLFLKSHV